jgi:hypothetical protein
LSSLLTRLTPLTDVVNGTSTSEHVDLPVDPSSRFVIAVHKSAAEIETRVACGDITDISALGGRRG